MTTMTMPASRTRTDTWLLVLMLWHGLLAVAGLVAVYVAFTGINGGLRFAVAGVLLVLALLSATTVPLIHRRDHRGRSISLVVNYLGFLTCTALLLDMIGAFTGIDDLAQRGMLDSTLVMVLTEFGRTPNINYRYGRDHWGKGFSIALAGCGIQPGAVIGAMNKDGTEIADREVKPADLFHTYLRAIGLDPQSEFDIDGRSVPMADPTGMAVEELLA